MLSTATTPTLVRRPSIGDSVKHDGFDAILIDAHPDGSVDLVYSEAGRRRITSNVPRGLGPGSWSFAEDRETTRPKTPLEQLADARARGDRVPEVGARVVFGSRPHRPGWIEVTPTRATIQAVHSLTLVDLAVHDADPPVDPEAPDPVRSVVRNARAASSVGDFDPGNRHEAYVADTAKKCGFPGCWAWLDGHRQEMRLPRLLGLAR